MMIKEMTRSEYEYKLAELERIEQEIEVLESDKKALALDGCDEEKNPAFGYNRRDLCAAYQRRDNIKMELNNIKIVEPKKVGEGEFSEYAKSITLKSTFSEDDVEVETLTIGREGFNCISPSSPLFKFLHGKKVGFKDIFRHSADRIGEIVYEVEILAIEF